MTNDNEKPKRRGLGRGLESILGVNKTESTTVISEMTTDYMVGSIAEINIDLIEANPFQPRVDFDEMALTELAVSIRNQGVIQPITVRKLGTDKFQLISGERRLRASKLADLKKIPVFIRFANDEQMLEMALIENIHRENLNAIEVAISYQRLIDECSLTQEGLSDRIGKSRSDITNYLGLLKLPAEIQVAVRDGHISMGHARAIKGVNGDEKQLLLLQKIVENDLNVRQVEALVRDMKNTSPSKKTEQKNIVPDAMKSRVKNLEAKLQTKIDIRRNINGKGTLVITFQNDAEFDRLINSL
ncbi:MAG: ParB/RepB/Spo0J family partition protein [Lentimicrobiaceae bacterium]|jgi:ParB family chromosome partitioning protein|nr:ParB/RepB/Spo0J family partition protein [Lentimicrobiaceae bacterium]